MIRAVPFGALVFLLATLFLTWPLFGQSSVPPPTDFDAIATMYQFPDVYIRLSWSAPGASIDGYEIRRRVYDDESGRDLGSKSLVNLPAAATRYEDHDIFLCHASYYYDIRSRLGSSRSEPAYTFYYINQTDKPWCDPDTIAMPSDTPTPTATPTQNPINPPTPTRTAVTTATPTPNLDTHTHVHPDRHAYTHRDCRTWSDADSDTHRHQDANPR